MKKVSSSEKYILPTGIHKSKHEINSEKSKCELETVS